MRAQGRNKNKARGKASVPSKLPDAVISGGIEAIDRAGFKLLLAAKPVPTIIKAIRAG